MIHITPVSVVDDGEEHIEQDEEAAKDVEDEEPGTFKNGILRVFFLIGPSIAPKSKTRCRNASSGSSQRTTCSVMVWILH